MQGQWRPKQRCVHKTSSFSQLVACARTSSKTDTEGVQPVLTHPNTLYFKTHPIKSISTQPISRPIQNVVYLKYGGSIWSDQPPRTGGGEARASDMHVLNRLAAGQLRDSLFIITLTAASDVSNTPISSHPRTLMGLRGCCSETEREHVQCARVGLLASIRSAWHGTTS